jgi:hypothetical protein
MRYVTYAQTEEGEARRGSHVKVEGEDVKVDREAMVLWRRAVKSRTTRRLEVKTHPSQQTILRERTIPGLPRGGMGMTNPPRMALPWLMGVLPPPHPLTSGNAILRGKTSCDTRY